jgi:membrane associated rhomboid family serine protease
MLAALRRDFRFAPVTFCLLTASVVLFFVVEFRGTSDNDPLGGRRSFGAVEQLSFVGEKEVSGPFDLWDGPWWRWLRVPASAFHHAHLLHLFFNVTAIWYLGPMMERRVHRGAYLGFWFFAATVPLIPEYYVGHFPIGLSGVACALFGWGLIERQFDPWIAERLHDRLVLSFWMFLFLFIGLTAVGVMQIANIAHFAGVGYGWLNARAARSRPGRRAWVFGHLLVPIALYGLLHPVWDARYHAFVGRQAAQAANNLSAGVPHFRKAVELNPGLPRVWLSLAGERALSGENLEAWQLAIKGLRHNRSCDKLTDFSRSLWPLLSPEDRPTARKIVKQEFGSDALVWEKRLQMQETPPPTTIDSALRQLFTPTTTAPDLLPSEGHALEPPERRGRKSRKTHVDPDLTDSAAEGRTL